MTDLDNQTPLDSEAVSTQPPADPTGQNIPVYTRPWLLRGLNGLIVFCFFLPFCNVTCNGLSVLPITGVQLAFGGNVGGDDAFASASSFNIFALIALITAIISLGLFFMNAYKMRIFNIILGSLGALSLLALYIQLKLTNLSQYGRNNTDSDSLLGTSTIVSLNFTASFMLTLLLFGTITTLSYLLYRDKQDLA